MPSENPWRVEADLQASLKDSPDDAVLVLRLGTAVSALRAAHFLTLKVGEGTTPFEHGVRLWSFVLAVAYIHEAKVMALPNYPRLKELAISGGASEELVTEIGQLFSGKSRLAQMADRVRNQMVFHFDAGPVEEWVKKHGKDPVIWSAGIGRTVGKTLYRASLDTVADNLLPGDGNEEELQVLIGEVLPATERLLAYFDLAIVGYLNSVGATLVEEVPEESSGL